MVQDADGGAQVHAGTEQGGVLVLQVAGEVDMASAPGVLEALAAQLEGTQGAVVLDLTQVGFLDSAGIAMIVSLGKQLGSAGRGLVLAAASSGVVRQALRVTGLTTAFPVLPSRAQAVETAASGTAQAPPGS